MALAHWHGGVDTARFPEGFMEFGKDNPPVSCSTYQAAMYTLRGKLESYARHVGQGKSYMGDIHVEPHHGVNVSWPSLLGLAKRLLARNGSEEPFELPELSVTPANPRVEK